MRFRVWGPRAASLTLRRGERDFELAGVGDGWYEAEAPAQPGDDYRFVVDGEPLPDARSRWQPEGLRGPSRVPALSSPPDSP